MKTCILNIKHKKKITWLYVLLPVICTILFVTSYKIHQVQMLNTIKLSVLIYAVVFPLFMYHLCKIECVTNRGLKVLIGILSVLISQFITFGASLHATDSFAFISSDTISFVVYIVQSCCIWMLSYKVLTVFLNFLQTYNINVTESTTDLNLKKWFAGFFFVNMVCIALLYPCIFDVDGAFGLRTFLNPLEVKSNHHPYFVQMIHGLFFNLGKTIGNTSVGMALLTLLFDIIVSSLYVYGMAVLKKMEIGIKWIKAIGLLLAFSPFYLFLSHDPTKDGFFAYSFLAYSLMLLDIYATKGRVLLSWKFLTLHSITLLLLCLTRNQGIYIGMLESLLLLFFYRRYLSQLLLSIAPAIFCFLWFSNVYLPANNVEKSGKAETIGTLFQQTAYYLKCYPNDITRDERISIENLMSISKLKEVYNPEITDPVKGCYGKRFSLPPKDGLMHFYHNKIYNEDAKLSAYFKAWFSMFLRHPICYIESASALAYGFFYNKGQMLCILSGDWYLPEGRATTPEYSFYQNTKIMKLVNSFYGYAVHVPVLNWFFSIPYYDWLFIVLIGLLLYRKDWNGLLIAFPSILSMGVLLLCPVVNARYMYPILVFLPFLLIYVLRTNESSKSIQYEQ